MGKSNQAPDGMNIDFQGDRFAAEMEARGTSVDDPREVLQRVTAHLQAGTQGVRKGIDQTVPGTAPNATV